MELLLPDLSFTLAYVKVDNVTWRFVSRRIIDNTHESLTLITDVLTYSRSIRTPFKFLSYAQQDKPGIMDENIVMSAERKTI